CATPKSTSSRAAAASKLLGSRGVSTRWPTINLIVVELSPARFEILHLVQTILLVAAPGAVRSQVVHLVPWVVSFALRPGRIVHERFRALGLERPRLPEAVPPRRTAMGFETFNTINPKIFKYTIGRGILTMGGVFMLLPPMLWGSIAHIPITIIRGMHAISQFGIMMRVPRPLLLPVTLNSRVQADAHRAVVRQAGPLRRALLTRMATLPLPAVLVHRAVVATRVGMMTKTKTYTAAAQATTSRLRGSVGSYWVSSYLLDPVMTEQGVCKNASHT
ncbi:hypothetical protein P171DRAFT_499942, partial [Karstenula rhodostoma CBS 690.94]